MVSLVIFFLYGFLITFSAKWLIFLCLTEKYALGAFDGAVADVGEAAAAHADGVNLCHFIGDGAQGRHRTEGLSLVVHVKSRNDNTDTTVGEFVTHVGQSHVEKLCLVNAHYVAIGGKQQDTRR